MLLHNFLQATRTVTVTAHANDNCSSVYSSFFFFGYSNVILVDNCQAHHKYCHMTAVVHNKACSHVTDQQDPESFWNHLVPRLQVLQTNVQISVYLDWFQPNLETWKPPWTLDEQYVKLSLFSCQAAAVFAEHVLDTSALVISSSSNTGEIQVLPTRTHHEGKRCCNTSVVSTGWRLSA